MEHTHFIELIQTLNKEELKQLILFVENPFFNKGRFKEQILSLLEICLYHPWLDSHQKVEKSEVFAAVFIDQTFVEGKIEKLFVEAHKLLRTFLLIQNYMKASNEFQQTFDFSEIVRTRGLENRYQQTLSRLQRIQEQSNLRNSTYFYQQFLVEDAIYNRESLNNQAKGDLNVPKVLQSLEIHYFLCRIARLNSFLLQQKVARVDTSELAISFLEQSPLPEHHLKMSPVLRINHEIFFLLRKNRAEPQDVRALFDLLRLYEEELDPASLREFYTYLRNICVLISTSFFDNEEIRLTLFELYKDNLSRGYLHYESKLHPNTYLAVTLAAVRVRQFNWAIEFIENHKNEVIGDNEERDIYRFNLAVYLFGIGQFSNCLDNIPPTSPFVDYLLHGKRLELRALYELQSDLLAYKLDAFKMFLSRTSQKLLSEAQRQTNSDFANLLHQLVNSKPADPKRSELLVSRLHEKKQSAEWRWLLEKAKALKST